MNRSSLAAALGAIAILASAATADAETYVLTFKRCTDTTRAPEKRIQDCQKASQAQGIESVEVAFATVNLGAAYQTAGDEAKALAAYDKAIALNPDLWEALYDRASLHLHRHEIDAASADVARLEYLDKAGQHDQETLDMLRLKYGVSYVPVGQGSPGAAQDLTMLKEQLAAARLAH